MLPQVKVRSNIIQCILYFYRTFFVLPYLCYSSLLCNLFLSQCDVDFNDSSIQADNEMVNMSTGSDKSECGSRKLRKTQNYDTSKCLVHKTTRSWDDRAKRYDKMAIIWVPITFFFASVLYWTIYVSNG